MFPDITLEGSVQLRRGLTGAAAGPPRTREGRRTDRPDGRSSARSRRTEGGTAPHMLNGPKSEPLSYQIWSKIAGQILYISAILYSQRAEDIQQIRSNSLPEGAPIRPQFPWKRPMRRGRPGCSLSCSQASLRQTLNARICRLSHGHSD